MTPTNPNSDESVVASRHIAKLMEAARRFVGLVGLAFLLAFTWAHFPTAKLLATVVDLGSDTIVIIGLFVYYYSWIFAVGFESKLAERVYITDPERGKLPKGLAILAVLLVAIGIALFYFYNRPRVLSVLLAATFIIEVLMWLTFRHVAAPKASASAARFASTGDTFSVEMLDNYVKRHLGGRWQVWRFIAMALALGLFVVSSYDARLSHFASSYLHGLLPAIGERAVFDVCPALLFLLYILIQESIWVMRFLVGARLALLHELRNKYQLERRSRAPASAENAPE